MKKIGLRTIKTGIAVFLATLAGYYGLVETPVYTVSVCIFSIKNTMKNSVEDAMSRIIGTLLGGFVGFLFATFIHENIISTTIGVIIIIHLCNLLKISESAGIACVTFTAISLGVGKNYPLTYSLMRTMDTLVGVLIALIVNYSVSRHKYLKYLWTSFKSTSKDYFNIIFDMINRKDYSSSYLKLQNKFNELGEYYTQLIDELPYSDETSIPIKLHEYYDICEQLLHHVHGLYLLDKKIYNNEVKNNNNDSIYKYHTENISKLISYKNILDMENRDR